jgi:lipopolysaccharide export system protein LptA
VTVDGERPSAILPVEAAPGAPAAEPYRIQANRLRFQGDQFFWGDGNVEVLRGETRATADSLAYDRTVGTLILNRDAVVDRDDVRASGGTLNLGFTDDRLTSVLARRGGRIVTDDITLGGLQVQVTLDENEEVSSVLAEGGEDPETGQHQDATLEAENLFLRGSRQVEIEDDADGNRVLVATGNARAESLGERFGSVADGGPPPAEESPAAADSVPGLEGVPDRDWVEGEEIVALLERVAPEEAAEPLPDADDPDAQSLPAPADADAEAASANGATFRLVRLTSTNNAKALYRSPPEETNDADETDATGEPPADPASDEETATPAGPGLWPISYILADLIIIHLVEGEVRLLEAEGNVTGLQLEPAGGGSG